MKTLVADPAKRPSPALSARRPKASGDRSADVYQRLRDQIVSGAFQPNERLVEADLARRLESGRTAIRAALVRLDQEGLVSREPNRGARVRLITEREAIEIEQVRIALERLLARQAAERATAADLDDLRSSLAQMRARVAEGDPLGYSELNAEFHLKIWTIADHQLASKLLTTLRSQSIRFQFRTILRPGRTGKSLGEHEAIVEALAAHDPDGSEAAMAAHLSHVLETLKWAIDAQHRQPRWLAR